MLAGGLLLAGTDTTRNQVAASVQVLCEHPDQWELLKEHPELAMRAVEETMRHSPIACGTLRLVVEDTELDDYIFPAGTMVLVNTAAANRDPTVYDDPDRVDITREGAPAILTFGGGVHYCLGANLARREIAEALNVLLGRLRNPRTAGPAPWKPATFRFSDGLAPALKLFALVRPDAGPAIGRVGSARLTRWPHLGPMK